MDKFRSFYDFFSKEHDRIILIANSIAFYSLRLLNNKSHMGQNLEFQVRFASFQYNVFLTQCASLCIMLVTGYNIEAAVKMIV